MKPSERIAQIARSQVDAEVEQWRKDRSDQTSTAFFAAITGTDVTDAAFVEARLTHPALWLNAILQYLDETSPQRAGTPGQHETKER